MNEPSVDCPARLRFAAAIAAYMRGDIDNLKLDDEVLVRSSQDHILDDIKSEIWFFYDDLKSHPISVDQRGWDALRRVIAFLKSDLQVPQVIGESSASCLRKRRLIALASLTSIVLGIYSSISVSPFFLLLPPVLIGLPFAVGTAARSNRDRVSHDTDEFYPFLNEAEWKKYEPHVLNENLPAYNPDLHVRKTPLRQSIFILFPQSVEAFTFSVLFRPLLCLGALLPSRRRSTFKIS